MELQIGGIVLPLDASSENELERVISNSIAFSIDKVLGYDQIENLDIIVTLVSPPPERKLYERTETIAFDAWITIQSILDVHDVDRYTIGAFNDAAEQVLFLQALKNTADPAFANVTSVSLVGQDHVVRATETPNDDGAGVEEARNAAGVATALFVAIAAVLSALAAFVYYYRQRTKGTNLDKVAKETKEGKVANETVSRQVDKVEHGSIPSDRAWIVSVKDLNRDGSTTDEEEIPSEIVVDTSSSSSSDDSNPRDGPAREISDLKANSVAASDEAKSSRDIALETASMLSGESMDYDFDDIFRIRDGDSLGDSNNKTVVRREISLTSASEKGKVQYISPMLELNASNETKLLDEDDNTVEEDEFVS